MGQTAASNAGTNISGLSQLTDQVIASDLMIYAKAGVQMAASALTESSTTEVRNILKKQLGDAVMFQELVGAYIADRGWVKADNMKAQLEIDVKKTQETMELLRDK